MGSFRSFDEAFAWLSSRTNYETMAVQRYDERTYGIGRMRRLLAACGRPDRAFATVQVVGSKGKGSASAALAAVLAASGRRTGLFTSPHLVHARERVQASGDDGAFAPVPDDAMRDALASLVPHVDAAAARGEPLTFFEVHTAAALLAFAAESCDAAVLEAGMGGRLDATTAADARGVVLTSVSLDHTAQLGRTRGAIAAEKAAAARRGRPFVCGEPVTGPVGSAVRAACRGSRLLAAGRDFRVSRARTSFDRATGRSETTFRLSQQGFDDLDLAVPLLGVHQARNAALAAVAARVMRFGGPRISDHAIREGISRTSIRARLEALSTDPLVLVDGAHTPASFRALAASLRAVLPGECIVCVVGMSSDKDMHGSLRALRGVAAHVVATTSGQPRAASPDALAALARAAGLAASAAPDISSALAAARRRARRMGVVVVTGSLYLCGAALAAGGSRAASPAAGSLAAWCEGPRT
ncbi:MAG: Folylpolyglutamate synthase [Planctomycetes bacterium]|nr:Folylpolyglutamate synthase [Planctomycetota bacterium]